jgi:hypothetical protein
MVILAISEYSNRRIDAGSGRVGHTRRAVEDARDCGRGNSCGQDVALLPPTDKKGLFSLARAKCVERQLVLAESQTSIIQLASDQSAAADRCANGTARPQGKRSFRHTRSSPRTRTKHSPI